jgi:hypothetical protein
MMAMWRQHFQQIANSSDNVIAANNLYDLYHMKYYTGVEGQLLPSYCGYTQGAVYTQTRPGFLISMRGEHSFQEFFVNEFRTAAKSLNSSTGLRPIKDVYGRYSWADLAAHRGIVHIPHQPSVMSGFEQYRMNIPLFFPSNELMVEWEMNGHFMLTGVYNILVYPFC